MPPDSPPVYFPQFDPQIEYITEPESSEISSSFIVDLVCRLMLESRLAITDVYFFISPQIRADLHKGSRSLVGAALRRGAIVPATRGGHEDFNDIYEAVTLLSIASQERLLYQHHLAAFRREPSDESFALVAEALDQYPQELAKHAHQSAMGELSVTLADSTALLRLDTVATVAAPVGAIVSIAYNSPFLQLATGVAGLAALYRWAHREYVERALRRRVNLQYGLSWGELEVDLPWGGRV